MCPTLPTPALRYPPPIPSTPEHFSTGWGERKVRSQCLESPQGPQFQAAKPRFSQQASTHSSPPPGINCGKPIRQHPYKKSPLLFHLQVAPAADKIFYLSAGVRGLSYIAPVLLIAISSIFASRLPLSSPVSRTRPSPGELLLALCRPRRAPNDGLPSNSKCRHG